MRTMSEHINNLVNVTNRDPVYNIVASRIEHELPEDVKAVFTAVQNVES